jgi:hypothetical protein
LDILGLLSFTSLVGKREASRDGQNGRFLLPDAKNWMQLIDIATLGGRGRRYDFAL